MRIVLVEPFYGGSHAAWVDGWRRNSTHDITLLAHPGEFWRWRLRGAAVTLAERFVAHVDEHGRPDAVIVSGLMDVATFAGLARRAIQGVPVAMYAHESQLLYPLAPNQRPQVDAALTNWRSLLAVDQVWFNSGFHRDELCRRLPAFLDSQPEPKHGHLVDAVFEHSRVLWPGVDTADLLGADRSARSVPRVLWNQRWDHDKNPRAVFSALAALADEGVAFTLALAGQNQRAKDPELAWVQKRLADRIDHVGFLPVDEYRQLLLDSDVVVSAADHEFFGIAVVEAVAAGAVPVLPRRLSFPELIEDRWHRTALYSEGELRTRLRVTLDDLEAARRALSGLRQSMARFDWQHAARAHDQAVLELVRLR